MFKNFYRLLRSQSNKIVPLTSIVILNIFKKQIFQQVHQKKQNGQVPSFKKLNQNFKNQGWNWQRIKQIDSPQQLSPQDIRNKTIICYQMTGNYEIDSQVALIAHLFCDKYFGKISQKYQFIFLNPSPSSYQIQQQNIFVVFGRQGSKYISLKKYLKKPQSNIHFIPNYQNLFKKILSQVNLFQQLNVHNLSQHLQLINCTGRDSYQLIVLPQQQNDKGIKKSKNILEIFLKNKQIWNSQIIKGVVTDHQTKIVLGLNRYDICPNKVYLIAPQNQNILIKVPQNTFRIGNKKYSIIPGQQIPNNFIFTPIPPKMSSQQYLLKVNIDLNQTKPELIDGIYQLMKDQNIKNIPKLLNYSKSQQPIQITIQKNNYDNIVNAYDSNCMYDNNSKKDLLFESHVWKYPHRQLNSENLKQFVKMVTNQTQQNKAQKQKLEFYRSQSESISVQKNSKLIVGQQRKSICQKPQDKIIFHYSKSCHSCKRFGGMYQQIVKQQKRVNFYRIDNDNNKTEGLKNYNSTPIFVMYKKQNPNLEWYFKMPYFTKVLFNNFIDITRQVAIMDSQKLSQHFNQYIKNQSLVEQTLKSVL